MTRASVAVVAIAGCAADMHNPPILWLGLDGGETHAALIDHDPPPF